MALYLPTSTEIEEMLSGLIGDTVTLVPTLPYAPQPGEPAGLATYVDDADAPAAYIVSDLNFGAYGGAAIGAVPAAAAEAAIANGDMNDVLRENFYEVMNILANLFNAPGTEHMKLRSMSHASAGGMEWDDWGKALFLGRRTDFAVTISGYGTGRLSTILLRD